MWPAARSGRSTLRWETGYSTQARWHQLDWWCTELFRLNWMQEFEDHFDDEIDFTPPAEDTPSMQSPAEVYTLAVSPVALPGPPHLQPPGRITGRTHALSETLGQRHFVITTVSVVTLIPCLFCFLIGLTEGSPEFQVARHNLSYIQEIGNGWFGQVSSQYNSLPRTFTNFPWWSSGNTWPCLFCLRYNRLFWVSSTQIQEEPEPWWRS